MTVLASTLVVFSLTAGFLNGSGVFIGCLLALTAAGVYVFSIRRTAEEDVGLPSWYPAVFAVALVGYLLLVSFAMTHENVWTSRAPNLQ